jgi:hypothetical protein
MDVPSDLPPRRPAVTTPRAGRDFLAARRTGALDVLSSPAGVRAGVADLSGCQVGQWGHRGYEARYLAAVGLLSTLLRSVVLVTLLMVFAFAGFPLPPG